VFRVEIVAIKKKQRLPGAQFLPAGSGDSNSFTLGRLRSPTGSVVYSNVQFLT